MITVGVFTINILIPTDEELPKGDLTKTGPDTTSLMSNPWFKRTKKPDYKIEGEIFDCISPEAGTSANNIILRIEREKIGEGQARRIVLNMDDSTTTVDELREALKKHPINGLDQILVVKDNQVINLFPFR